MARNIENKLEEKAGYSYKEVLDSSLKYFNGDELAATTWINKYAIDNKKSGKNKVYFELNPNDMHKRMAKEFARIESSYIGNEKSKVGLSDYGRTRENLTENKIYDMFKDFGDIIPQGSVMASLGDKNTIASLSNCVVIPAVEDSYGGIFYTDQQMAQLFKRRCGVGVDMSKLRPSNSYVNNSAKTTSGSTSFMERFSNTTREVAQNGRRGALMLTMDIAHPDVENFIEKKQDLTKVTGANVSVRLSDEFMQAVVDNKDYIHRWPIDSSNPKYTKKSNAKTLFNKIIKCAHNTAEPGIIFWDKQHKYSPSSVYPGFENSSTNPCGEIAMQGGDSCRLIAANLYNFVEKPFTKDAKFNYDRFSKTIYETQRLMDDLVDLELEAVGKIKNKMERDKESKKIKQIEMDVWDMLYENGRDARRTGLGFTALADTMAALGHKFDSNESINELEKIMKIKYEAEFNSSIDMAIERGAFKSFNPKYENKSEFVQMMKEESKEIYERMMKNGRRNISISTVAPTGSLSMLAQTSAGIEPVFLTNYKRRRKINSENANAKVDYVDDMGDSFEEFMVYHHNLKEWMEINNEKDISKSPYFGATSMDIDWKKRLDIQSVAQKYTTHSISSTINLPKDVSVERVGEIYIEAWKKGLKGVTVYRDGSRSGILVSDNDKGLEGKVKAFPDKRPESVDAEVLRFNNGVEPWVAITGLINGKPYELFTGPADDDSIGIPKKVKNGRIIKVKNGTTHYDFKFITDYGYESTAAGISHQFDKSKWNNSRMISGMLRNEVPIEKIVDIVSKLYEGEDESINSWKSGTIRALKKYIPNGARAKDKECNVCGDPNGLIYEEGCLKCKNCGNSKCG